MPRILAKLHFVESGDGQRRARIKWGNHRSFVYFATIEEIRELARDLLMLLQDEERYFSNRKDK